MLNQKKTATRVQIFEGTRATVRFNHTIDYVGMVHSTAAAASEKTFKAACTTVQLAATVTATETLWPELVQTAEHVVHRGLTTAKIGTESKLFVLKPRKSAWPRNGNSLGTTAALDGIGCTDDLRLIL